MKKHSRNAFCSALLGLALVTSLTWAATTTPFGLLKMERGQAAIDGRNVSTAQLVSRGQTLVLEAGERALIRFFGSASEIILEGPREVVLEPSRLMPEARKVKRNQLKVSDSIGSRVSAGAVTRGAKDLKPLLPPREVLESSEVFELVFSNLTKEPNLGELSLNSDSEVRVEIHSTDTEGEGLIFRQDYLEKITNPIIRTNRFQQGHNYLLSVSVTDGYGTRSYELEFRFLTEEERRFLNTLEEELTQKFRESQDPRHLVLLAQTYGELKQAQKAHDVLQMLSNLNLGPEYRHLKQDIAMKMLELKRALAMPLGNASS